RKAAQALGVNHAIVSRHLRALEDHLGVALIERPTNVLTAEGRSYHRRVAMALAELEQATDAVAGRQEHRLHIWCAPGFAYHWLTRRLAGFRASHPLIDLDLRPADVSPGLGANEADGDIRYVRDGEGLSPQPGVRGLELARPAVYPVASPRCAEQLAERIHTAEDFLAAPLILENDDMEWRAWLRLQGVATGELKPVARLWHAHVALVAAREGQGVALANDYLVGDDLAAGRLVRVVPTDRRIQDAVIGGYAFFAREDRWRKDPIMRFRNWLKAEVSA
ncbi:MAG: LysR substrate-binding domain-containing protein, partial [Phenylobacterium sp.]